MYCWWGEWDYKEETNNCYWKEIKPQKVLWNMGRGNPTANLEIIIIGSEVRMRSIFHKNMNHQISSQMKMMEWCPCIKYIHALKEVCDRLVSGGFLAIVLFAESELDSHGKMELVSSSSQGFSLWRIVSTEITCLTKICGTLSSWYKDQSSIQVINLSWMTKQSF